MVYLNDVCNKMVVIIANVRHNNTCKKMNFDTVKFCSGMQNYTTTHKHTT